MTFARRRPLAGLAVLGAAALIAGCGGGDDSEGLSADEFRSQADAICADFDARTDALSEPDSAAAVLPFLQEGLAIQADLLGKLRALEPPSDLSGAYDETLGLLDQRQAAIQAAADRIAGGEDAEAVITEAGVAIDALDDQADAKATELGLSVCGDGDGESTPSTTASAPATVTAPATTAPATTAPAGTTAGGTDYLADVQAAATELQAFGTILSSSTGIEDLKAKVPEARGALDRFDAAIAKLDGYTIPVAALEKQRAGLAETGPRVSDVLRRFLAAAAEGDVSAVTELVPEVTKTIGEFQAAATG